jgi:hypothetical protein
MNLGRRSDIVFKEGLRSGNTAFLALAQSMYSVESALAQNSRSSASDLNFGIFFMVSRMPSFLFDSYP